MTKKKKEVPMPELKKKWFQKIEVKYVPVIMLVLASVVCMYTANKFLATEKQFVKKDVVNNFVCKIVGADTEKDMFAVECLTK